MSRRWLLSLLCLSVLCLSMVQLTRAHGELRVNETLTRIHLEKRPAEVLLAVENLTGRASNARVQVELLDPRNRVTAQITGVQAITAGSQVLNLSLPISLSNLKENERRQLLWYRLHYRLSEEGSPADTATEGIISLSEITPDLFEIRVAASEFVREGGRYRARVQAIHPITRRPAVNVRIDGELTLDDDNDKSVKLRNGRTTDTKGYALLEFVLPQRFPQFPHKSRPTGGGEIHVVGQNGAIVTEAKADVLVDQFAHILISSDKPLYQPGQVMHVRALVFTPSKHALANQNVVIRICNPENTTIFRTVVKSSRFGIVNADWVIPENTRLGDYRIWVGVDGGEEDGQTTYDVRISRYDLPNFTVNVQPDRRYYLPGQDAEVRVRADYLFGKPVARGHVRVVRETEREWNYREQKWDIVEGDKYEGETDDKGIFVAHLKLAKDHREVADRDYDRFKDATYAAYFTDPTTNRTEQRRFDLRVTKEAIHVYVVENYYRDYNRALPLKFYISTFYADGSPARCKVTVRLTNAQAKKSLALRTNRYGLAKVNGLRLAREFENRYETNLVVSAVDSQGQKGTNTQDLSLDDGPMISVETDKALYRAGEPINVFITSSTPDKTVVVDLARDSSVIRSERVQLHNGRGSVTFPYKSDFKDRLAIAAYEDFSESQQMIDTRTILYPRNSDLKVNVQTSQTSYRPGEDAQVNLSVRAPEGGSTESAVGVVVLDKAVEERFRTDREFGQHYTFNDSLQRFLGVDQQLSGVTLRDLQQLDMRKPVSPDLDLLAEILLNQGRDYYPSFHSSDQYETEQLSVFRDSIKEQLEPVREALVRHYVNTSDYPKDEASLRRLLSESQIDSNTLHDPWGIPYRAIFFVERQTDALTLVSAGADKRFETDDDFSVERFGWPYFGHAGGKIDKAVRRYHDRTGGFIRDFSTLKHELISDGLELDRILDRWGKPYRFEFNVKESSYVIEVSSGGPDGQFSPDESYGTDDFVIWTSPIDYFAEHRARIQATLIKNLKSTKKFPQTDRDLREALRDSGESLGTLQDPWGRPYYRVFTIQSLYADRTRIENRANAGEPVTQRMEIIPVTQTLATIRLRSMGADGQAGTLDDFNVATFSEVIAEQQRGQSRPQLVTSTVVFSGTGGAIYGVLTDVNGASISGATIIATRSVDEQSYRTSSNEEGKYTFLNLPPGLYEIRFEALGFSATVVTNVLVRVSNLMEVNTTLQVGATAEVVTVTAAGSSLQTQTSDASVNASRSTVQRVTQSIGSQQVSTPRLREYFPETLLWQPSIETDKQGRAKINFKLADNITTWKMAVIGSTEDGLIGTAETEIKAFQPFFVEHDPPRVLTEGDEISLPVVVRNYLDRAQNVNLEIKPESWFSLLGPARKQTAVAASGAARETFDLRAIASVNDGKQRITATGSEVSDAIEKPVTVHPDGEELSLTDGDLLGSSAMLELNVPETMIPNSKRAELRIYPNLMAHVIESVEAIMSRPYSCAEQTISSTYPSLLLLRHYKQTGEDFPLRARAQRYLDDGYSRLLNYLHDSGGFTYWGRGEPDVALTAYALRFLTDAAGVIAVDEEVIDKAREWLMKQQRADGSWPAHDYWTNRENIRRTALLTAYVTRVLTVTGTKRAPSDLSAVLKHALAYLDHRANEIDEPYLLASYALAAIDAKDTARAKPVIDKLRSIAHAEGSTTFWSLETNTPFYGWGVAGRVETTALAIKALTRYCETANCEADTKLINRAMLFLFKQKDCYGMWYSTQATINVLDAMLTLLSTKSIKQAESAAEVMVNGRVVRTIQMPAGNGLAAPITFDISQFVRTGNNIVELKRASGSPFASVQALVNYYVPWSASNAAQLNESSDLRLKTSFDKTEGRINDTITCHVAVERVGFRGYGMMLAEIGLPPGADVDRSSLETAMKGSSWSISQYDVLPDRVVLYLWAQPGGVRFDFQFRPRFGLNAQTAPAVVYDYYNPESRATLPPARFIVK